MKKLWPPLAWAVLFVAAHTQAPLYYSNQHQYFLHGLAQGGLGDLDRDWLANTADPTPVFSALVALTYRHLGEWPFYAYYAVLLGAYFLSLVALCDALPFAPRGAARVGLLTLLVVAHAAVVRLASVRLFGVDYPWYLQCGVANQYVLGPGLQPSAFGVLLVASLAAFANGRPALAAACCCAAAVVHPTYLLTAGLMTLGYMAALARERRWRAALLLGAASLLAVLPVVVYNLRTFAPSTPEAFAEAQRLIVHLRIPHHARIERWLAPIDIGQALAVFAAVWLVRKTPLFLPAAVTTAGALILTLVQAATDSDSLALLFPWRASAVLVPVATAVILARLMGAASDWLGRRPERERSVWTIDFVAVAVAAALGGVVVTYLGLGYRQNDEELAPLAYIRAHKQPGDVYLIPVTVPKLAAGKRGTASTTFTPPPRAVPGATLIPVDLLRFRLTTGAPLFVDFKSIPYRDAEVLEWHRRVRLCEGWYEKRPWDAAVIDELTREGVTHVLTTADREVVSPDLQLVYIDEAYRIYRVRRADPE